MEADSSDPVWMGIPMDILKNDSVCFKCPHGTKNKDVVEQLVSSGYDDVLSVHIGEKRRCTVTFLSHDNALALVDHGVEFGGKRLRPYFFQDSIVSLHVSDAPIWTPNDVILTALSQYGSKVGDVRYGFIQSSQGAKVYTGVRFFEFRLKKNVHVPSYVRLEGEDAPTVRVKYDDQPRTCKRCHEAGHELADCPHAQTREHRTTTTTTTTGTTPDADHRVPPRDLGVGDTEARAPSLSADRRDGKSAAGNSSSGRSTKAVGESKSVTDPTPISSSSSSRPVLNAQTSSLSAAPTSSITHSPSPIISNVSSSSLPVRNAQSSSLSVAPKPSALSAQAVAWPILGAVTATAPGQRQRATPAASPVAMSSFARGKQTHSPDMPDAEGYILATGKHTFKPRQQHQPVSPMAAFATFGNDVDVHVVDADPQVEWAKQASKRHMADIQSKVAFRNSRQPRRGSF